MIRKFIKGVPGRGDEVKKVLMDLGGLIGIDYDWSCSQSIFWINGYGYVDACPLSDTRSDIITECFEELHLPEAEVIQHHSQIDEVITEFDWSRVHSVMDYLNWTWASCKGRVPEAEFMRERILKYLKEASACVSKSRKDYLMETGGFRIEVSVHDTQDLSRDVFLLSFVVESWRSLNDE